MNITYCGPLWEDGVKGLAEMVRIHVESENLPVTSAKSVFSVFVEQVTNMSMYSAEKKIFPRDISVGALIFSQNENLFFVQTKNIIKNEHIQLVKGRIDHLNTLDKKDLRKYYKECLRSDNDNPESKGAGLGLIEIARRVTAPIAYKFEPAGENTSHFTMYSEISQLAKEEN